MGTQAPPKPTKTPSASKPTALVYQLVYRSPSGKPGLCSFGVFSLSKAYYEIPRADANR